MILVKVSYYNNSLHKIVVSGHAMYDEYGKDIVCSAVSTCVITTINGILEIQKDAIFVEEKNNQIVIEVKQKDNITLKLLNNMIEMLKSLESQYPKNIRLSKEEI